MDPSSSTTPPPEVAFGLTGDDDQNSGNFETVSDDDFFEACLASADLRELGLPDVSAAMGWRAWRAANQLFEEYRDARYAEETGCPLAAERLKSASARLLQATRGALTGFLGWSDAMEEQE